MVKLASSPRAPQKRCKINPPLLSRGLVELPEARWTGRGVAAYPVDSPVTHKNTPDGTTLLGQTVGIADSCIAWGSKRNFNQRQVHLYWRV